MNENMTNKEQLAWVFRETGRQIVAPFWAAVDYIYHELPYRIAVSRLQNKQNREKLEALEDPTLIDRMWMGEPAQPFTMRAAAQALAAAGHELRRRHIPVIANDEPVQIPVRFKIRRALSIDGILAR